MQIVIATDDVIATGEEPRESFSGSTLVEVLRRRAGERPDAEHLVLLPEEDGEPRSLSFGQLLEGAEAVARGLRARGVEPRQTVALMLPTGFDFYLSFLGVLLAGAVPVPLYPPVKLDGLEEYAARQVGILGNAQARALITERRAQVLAGLLRPKVRSLDTLVRADKLLAEGRRDRAGGAASPEVNAGDLALIQYTSGSTGDPKGVTLSHANLIANIRSIGEAVSAGSGDVVVSWLPLYHDMGLIGCWLFALCHGLKMVSFSPLAFLRRPKRWLRAISDYRGSLSPAPNFAYELALRRIHDRDLEGVDLSSWRWALNGAEPVSPQTLERFCQRFAPYGFRKEALKPVYGLAENAVALTFPAADEAPRVDRVEREAFERRRLAVVAGDGQAPGGHEPLHFVCVGRPIAGNEVRVVGDDGAAVPERVEGQIEFRGPSATPGYYRDAKATAAIRTADGWTRTGDRGYFAAGALYITGRSKDLIIKAGRNIHPTEVEAAAVQVDGIRKGCVAAFGVAGAGGREDLVVVAETRKQDPQVRARLVAEVRRQVRATIAVAPDVVELVPLHTVPKTPSGKLRRAETRARFIAGELTPRRPPVWLQVVRLGSAALAATGVAWIWRIRSRRAPEAPAAGEADAGDRREPS